MKKTLGVVAAAALAAMPVVGVFAADGTKEFTDTITVTIDTACGIYEGAEKTTPVTAHSYSKTMTNNSLWNLENDATFGGSYNVTCNDTTGWDLMAIGDSAGKTKAYMDASTEEADDIASNATITSGDTASWAFKIAQADTGITNSAANYTNVPAETALKVLTTGGATDKANGNFKTGYQVFIGTKTPAGTYTGKVKYSLVHPAAS